MTAKTISTPDLFGGFAGDSDRSSRGVSEVVGTASLIVLALGLAGGVAAGLGGVTDGINNNGLDGEFEFNQDGDKVTIVAESLSDAATDADATFAIQVEGQTAYDPAAKETGDPTSGGSNAEQKTTVDSTISDGSSGNDNTAGALEAKGTAPGSAYEEDTPTVGEVYTLSDADEDSNENTEAISEGDTITITAFDGEGNSQIIAQFDYGSL